MCCPRAIIDFVLRCVINMHFFLMIDIFIAVCLLSRVIIAFRIKSMKEFPTIRVTLFWKTLKSEQLNNNDIDDRYFSGELHLRENKIKKIFMHLN